MEPSPDRFVVRGDDTVVEEFDGGLVIYDGREARAHWLDPTASAVWRACREPRTEAEIAGHARLDGARCEIVLSQLIDLGLVEAERGSGYSRRAVLRTAAKVGLGGAMAAPIISAVVPVAAAAASGGLPRPPIPPSPLPDPGTQTIGADRTLVPGPPEVSGVTVLVGGGDHRSNGFSIRRASVNRHGVIVLMLSARSAGAFTARALFKKERPRSHGAYGSGSAILAKRGSVKLSIFPTTTAARALAAGRTLAVSITITFTPAGGPVHTITTSLTI